MSYSAGKGSKCCITCANWGGLRKLNSLKRAESSSSSTLGKCYAGRGPCSDGTKACYGNSCSSYEPWPPVK